MHTPHHAPHQGGAHGRAALTLMALTAMLACAPAQAQGTSCYGVPAVPTPPTSGYIDVRTYGAVPNDDIDDAKAIQDAINAAKDGQFIRFPAGRYLISTSLRVLRPGVTLWSDGATLHGTNAADHAVMLQADRTRIYGFTINSVTDRRRPDFEATGISATPMPNQPPLSGIVIQNNRIVPANSATGTATSQSVSAAGITINAVRDFTIAGNEVRRSLSDGIHIMGGNRNGRVLRNKVYQTGDDMISVVSYMNRDWLALSGGDVAWLDQELERTQTRNIWIAENTVSDAYWGRGMTVAGGANITLTRNQISKVSTSAGIYIAREQNPDWFTSGVRNVLVDSNTLTDVRTTRAGFVPSAPYYDRTPEWLASYNSGHAAVEVFFEHADQEQAVPGALSRLGLQGLTVRGNVINRVAAYGVRLGMYSTPESIQGVRLENNQIANAWGSYQVVDPVKPTCKNSPWLSSSAPFPAQCNTGPVAPVATGATLDCSRFPAP